VEGGGGGGASATVSSQSGAPRTPKDIGVAEDSAEKESTTSGQINTTDGIMSKGSGWRKLGCVRGKSVRARRHQTFIPGQRESGHKSGRCTGEGVRIAGIMEGHVHYGCR
jgi:hypothetical protein